MNYALLLGMEKPAAVNIPAHLISKPIERVEERPDEQDDGEDDAAGLRSVVYALERERLHAVLTRRKAGMDKRELASLLGLSMQYTEARLTDLRLDGFAMYDDETHCWHGIPCPSGFKNVMAQFNEDCEAVVEIIRRSGGATTNQLITETGCTRQRIIDCTKHLALGGKVRRLRDHWMDVS